LAKFSGTHLLTDCHIHGRITAELAKVTTQNAHRVFPGIEPNEDEEEGIFLN
jgi:hypothetical protein